MGRGRPGWPTRACIRPGASSEASRPRLAASQLMRITRSGTARRDHLDAAVVEAGAAGVGDDEIGHRRLPPRDVGPDRRHVELTEVHAGVLHRVAITLHRSDRPPPFGEHTREHADAAVEIEGSAGWFDLCRGRDDLGGECVDSVGSSLEERTRLRSATHGPPRAPGRDRCGRRPATSIFAPRGFGIARRSPVLAPHRRSTSDASP